MVLPLSLALPHGERHGPSHALRRQAADGTEWERIFTYDRHINGFFTLFAGADLFGDGNEPDKGRGVLGFRYLLPLNMESHVWIVTDGDARFNVEKSLELTPHLSLFGEAQYDTRDRWEGSVGLFYLFHKNISFSADGTPITALAAAADSVLRRGSALFDPLAAYSCRSTQRVRVG